MASNGTPQSALYQMRPDTGSTYRDRSMEQDNTNSGNPQGYVPPQFNGPGNTLNPGPLSYSVPQPNGVVMPNGPLSSPLNNGSYSFNPQLSPNMFIPNMGPNGPGGMIFGGAQFGIGSQLPQSPLGGLNGLPAPGQSSAPPPAQTGTTGGGMGYTNPNPLPPGVGPQPVSPPSGGSTQPTFTGFRMPAIPQFNDGSTASTQAKALMAFGSMKTISNDMSGFNARGSTGYIVPDILSNTSQADVNGSTPMSQTLRHLKALGHGFGFGSGATAAMKAGNPNGRQGVKK